MQLMDAVIKGLLLGLFLAVSVGPTLFAVIQYSLNHNYKAGLAFVLGVSISDIMYVTVANVASRWLEALNQFKYQIGIAGAIILMFVGGAGIIKKYKPVRPSSEKTIISGGHYFRIWLSGFIINTINPGVIITWLAAVTATATGSTTTYRIVLFGTCLGLILSIDFLKVFLADVIGRKLTPRRIMYLQKTSAICIFLIGIALLLETVFS